MTTQTLSAFQTTDSSEASRLSWKWPLILNFIRLPLILAGHFIVMGYFALSDHGNAWGAAVSMTNFYFPLTADLGSLLLLIWLVRREGVRLGSLINFDRRRWVRDILMGIGLFVLFYIAFSLTSLLSAVLVYGPGLFDPANAAQLQNGDFIMPPLWVFWWSLLVLPITVGVVEEMTYRGYIQPRLAALTGKPWLAIVIMAFGFGLQHIALPLTDWQTSLSRFISTFLLGLLFGAIYQKQKRLLPLIIAHWAIDFVGLGLFPLLWVMSQ